MERTRAQEREREMWTFVLGAATVDTETRKHLAKLECSGQFLSQIAAGIRDGNRDTVWRGVEANWGLTQSNGATVVETVLAELRRLGLKRRYSKVIAELAEARAAGDEPRIRSLAKKLQEVLGE